MIKDLISYDRNSYKTIIVSISELNKIFEKNNGKISIRTKSDDLFESYESYQKICPDKSFTYFKEHYTEPSLSIVYQDGNIPSIVVASRILQIKILDWYYDKSGNNVVIEYK